jgi:hypothetical protein
MSKRNGHHPLYRGPAKPIPTGVKFHPIDYAEFCVYALSVLVIALDLFYWSP